MTDYKLNAKKREKSGTKPEVLRLSGIIPGVVYGKGDHSTNVSVDQKEFNRIIAKAGDNALLELSIEGESGTRTVMAYDTQQNPVTDDVTHVDFFEVDMNKEIESEVPLEFVGESEAVENLEGTLITNKSYIEVRSLPANIPQKIEVSLEKLKTFDDSILAKDIIIPADVELLTDLEETIALVNPPRSEEELAELDEEVTENVESVEVSEEKGKDDDDSESKDSASDDNSEKKDS